MKIKNRLNKKINKIFKKMVDKYKLGVVLFNQDKEKKTKGVLWNGKRIKNKFRRKRNKFY